MAFGVLPCLQRWGRSASRGWGQPARRSSRTPLSCPPSPAPTTSGPLHASAGSAPGWGHMSTHQYYSFKELVRNESYKCKCLRVRTCSVRKPTFWFPIGSTLSGNARECCVYVLQRNGFLDWEWCDQREHIQSGAVCTMMFWWERLTRLKWLIWFGKKWYKKQINQGNKNWNITSCNHFILMVKASNVLLCADPHFCSVQLILDT